MTEAHTLGPARISFHDVAGEITEMVMQNAIYHLDNYSMTGRLTYGFVSNKLRRETGWLLPSNARLARRRRRIERLKAQRVGRR